MKVECREWAGRWLDHLLEAYNGDIERITADQAKAIELGDTGGPGMGEETTPTTR